MQPSPAPPDRQPTGSQSFEPGQLSGRLRSKLHRLSSTSSRAPGRRCGDGWSSWFVRPGDDHDEAVRKKALFLSFIPIALHLPGLVSDTVKIARWALLHGTAANVAELKSMLIYGYLFYLVRMLITKHLSRKDSTRAFVLLAVLCLSSDWASQVAATDNSDGGLWSPAWPTMVVITDGMLTSKSGYRAETFVLLMTVIYLTVRNIEECWRIGFWDIPTSANRTDTYSLCPSEGGACSKDCSAGLFFSAFSKSVVITVVDYFITRDFRDSTAASVRLAQDLAAAMARFDLAHARFLLDSASNAPEELRQAFNTLLRNLHRYRPFLPTALFAELDELESDIGDGSGVAHQDLRPSSTFPGAAAGSCAAESPTGTDMQDEMWLAQPSFVLATPGPAQSLVLPNVPTFSGAAQSAFAGQFQGRQSGGTLPGGQSMRTSSRGSSLTASTASHPRRMVSSTVSGRSPAADRGTGLPDCVTELQALQQGLSKRPVVMLGACIRPWAWVAQAAPTDISHSIGPLLEAVWGAAKACKGTIVGLRSQQATVAWGGVVRLASTTASTRAATCASTAMRDLERVLFPNEARVYCGIAGGWTQVGNVGTADSLEHTYIGPLQGTVVLLGHYAAAAGACVTELQALQQGLSKRPVVMLGACIRPWAWVAQAAPTDISHSIGPLLEAVWGAAKACKGTIVGLRSQQATVAWGGVVRLASTTASTRAATCASTAMRDLERVLFPNEARVYCGIAGGWTQVGNVGTADSLEHTYIGPLQGTVVLLGHYAAAAGAGVLCDGQVGQAVEAEWSVRRIDRFLLPAEAPHLWHNENVGRPLEVAELQEKRHAVAVEEWMYQLEGMRQEEQQRRGAFLQGVELLLRRPEPDAAGAALEFERHLAQHPADIAAQRLRCAAAWYTQHGSGPYARRAHRDPYWEEYPALPTEEQYACAAADPSFG
eukprot:TRINITY_DN15612_c0_g1_i1.p1 TRINITY_DN15612_c0_g1~~TRINITY_DN15612_c0_g1_i1.p1  ORF type:complete len:1034 (+),score=193.17 TRINITY_DN15612_c0_g1_i1:285-3104(+)